jgi:hypothetical protein
MSVRSWWHKSIFVIRISSYYASIARSTLIERRLLWRARSSEFGQLHCFLRLNPGTLLRSSPRNMHYRTSRAVQWRSCCSRCRSTSERRWRDCQHCGLCKFCLCKTQVIDSQISTKRNIKYEMLWLEECVRRASRWGVISDWRAERGRVEVAVASVSYWGRHVSPLSVVSGCKWQQHIRLKWTNREEPDGNTLRSKFSHKNASAGLRESSAVALWSRVCNYTPLIAICWERTIRRDDCSCRRRCWFIEVTTLD